MSGALFPGWRPDAREQAAIAPLLERLCASRPTGGPRLQRRRPDQWHVTLCFIGHHLQHLVTPGLLQGFAGVARRIRPHALRIRRLAHWPGPGAVVALPEPGHDELQALCDACHDVLLAHGIHPQRGTTTPHLTLAYLPRGLPVQAWVEAAGGDAIELQVQAFELLHNPGGAYHALAGWRLGDGDPAPPPGPPGSPRPAP